MTFHFQCNKVSTICWPVVIETNFRCKHHFLCLQSFYSLPYSAIRELTFSVGFQYKVSWRREATPLLPPWVCSVAHSKQVNGSRSEVFISLLGFPFLTQCPDCHSHGPFCCVGTESGMRATCRSMQPVLCLAGTCEHMEEELKLPTICIWKKFTQHINVGNYWLMFFTQCEIFLALDMSGDLKKKKNPNWNFLCIMSWDSTSYLNLRLPLTSSNTASLPLLPRGENPGSLLTFLLTPYVWRSSLKLGRAKLPRGWGFDKDPVAGWGKHLGVTHSLSWHCGGCLLPARRQEGLPALSSVSMTLAAASGSSLKAHESESLVPAFSFCWQVWSQFPLWCLARAE